MHKRKSKIHAQAWREGGVVVLRRCFFTSFAARGNFLCTGLPMAGVFLLVGIEEGSGGLVAQRWFVPLQVWPGCGELQLDLSDPQTLWPQL